jgi:hypothetical protein
LLFRRGGSYVRITKFPPASISVELTTHACRLEARREIGAAIAGIPPSATIGGMALSVTGRLPAYQDGYGAVEPRAGKCVFAAGRRGPDKLTAVAHGRPTITPPPVTPELGRHA